MKIQTTDYVNGQFYARPLTDLQPDPNQHRTYADPADREAVTSDISAMHRLGEIFFGQGSAKSAMQRPLHA